MGPALLMGSLPIVGFGAAIASLYWVIIDGGQNEFNMANTAWNSAIAIATVQMLYIGVLVAIFQPF